MKSSHRRVSRALVIVVSAVITLGVVFWLGKLSGSKAAGKPKDGSHVALAIPTPGADAKLASSSTTQPGASTPSNPILLAGSVPISTTQPSLRGGGDRGDAAARVASGTVTGSSALADAKAK